MYDMFKEAIETGRLLVEHGLNHPFSGNLSWRTRSGFYITRSGAMKNRLTKKDFVLCTKKIPEGASVESVVHEACYEKTDARAIIHAHPVHAILLSFRKKRILPQDAEGKYFLSEIPVLALKNSVGSSESASAVSKNLKVLPCVIVRGHGIFAKGKDLREAFMHACVAESVCRIVYLRTILNRDKKISNHR